MVKPAHGGWIGVDFDGTLAFYDGWTGWNQFGEPIPRMVERVKAWLAEGIEVRIVTARVKHHDNDTEFCRLTGEKFTNVQMKHAISTWCLQHVGQRLRVTCVKDMGMVELWDDRAVQVVANTGRTLAEEAEAVATADRGKP